MELNEASLCCTWKQETYRVCEECTAQKREAGTPYRCTQCGLWHAAADFASKHQNPRWSMYRVCLSCDAVKQCCVCKGKHTKEYFSVAAKKAREPKRRLCLRCQSKTRGCWKRTACQQRKPLQQFSMLISRRPFGEDGTQICNECRAASVQAAIRKRAATTSIGRLEPLRKRVRRSQVLRETWEAIADKRSLQLATLPVAPNTDTTTAVATQTAATDRKNRDMSLRANNSRTKAATPQGTLFTYECPYCQIQVTSRVATGQINASRQHCGMRFPVHEGQVVRRFLHACPTCGQEVQSCKRAGQIRIA